jgi:hypothetical protein
VVCAEHHAILVALFHIGRNKHQLPRESEDLEQRAGTTRRGSKLELAEGGCGMAGGEGEATFISTGNLRHAQQQPVGCQQQQKLSEQHAAAASYIDPPTQAFETHLHDYSCVENVHEHRD